MLAWMIGVLYNRLKRELAEVKIERVHKKAAAYFAKDSQRSTR